MEALDLNSIKEILAPFVALFLYIVTSGAGVAVVTQLLKDSRIPVPAATYPRATAAVLAVVATIISLYVGTVNVLLISPLHYVGLAVVILVASALTYRVLLRGLHTEKP